MSQSEICPGADSRSVGAAMVEIQMQARPARAFLRDAYNTYIYRHGSPQFIDDSVKVKRWWESGFWGTCRMLFVSIVKM